ncbi:MAG: hypothetical protein ACOH1E_02390 [Brevundimonas sp.]
MKVISGGLAWITALVILGFTAWGAWWLVTTVFTTVNAQQAIGLIAIVAAAVTAFVTFVRTKEKEAEARLFPEKAKVYSDILEVLNDLMSQSKPWAKKVSDDEVAKRLNDARYKLIVWGSGPAVKSFEEIETFVEGDVGDMLARLAYIYGWMRRDLGHKDSAYSLAHISAQHIVSHERPDAYEALIASPTFKTKVLPTFKGRPS